MTIRDRLSMAFMKRVIATPEGRNHILRELADAEGNGENGFFETILAKVDDANLRQVIQKHKADELRHEQMFLECAERTGIAAEPLPDSVKYVERIFQTVGFYEKPIETHEDIMRAYLLLQAVEERSVVQFKLMEQVFREAGDVITAQVFVAIGKDEERHIKYCQAVAKRYAPDAAMHKKRWSRCASWRRARSPTTAAPTWTIRFRATGSTAAPSQWFFRTLTSLNRDSLPLTPFAQEPAPRLAPVAA